MGNYRFVKEDYEDDHNPIDEINDRDTITLSDSLDINEETKEINTNLLKIDDGIQTAQMIDEFKTVFDDEYQTPKEVEVAVVAAIESLVEVINYKTPGINAVKQNAPGYKSAYRHFIKISKEGLLDSIGNFISKAVKAIIDMIKKFFNWISGKSDSKTTVEKENDKNKKTEEKQEKSQKLIDDINKNKNDKEKIEEIINKAVGESDDPKDVIKNLKDETKASENLNKLLTKATEFMHTHGSDVLFFKQLSEKELDIEKLIVHDNYLKEVPVILSTRIAVMKEIESATGEYYAAFDQIKSPEVIEKKSDEDIKRLYLNNQKNIDDCINAMMKEKNDDNKFGAFNVTLSTEPYFTSETSLGKQELYTIKVEKHKVNENMKVVCKSPEPQPDKVNDRSRWNNKITEFIEAICKIEDEINSILKDKFKESIKKYEQTQADLNELNDSSPGMTEKYKIFIHSLKALIHSNLQITALEPHYTKDIETVKHFVSNICRDILNASDDYEDLHAVVVTI